MSFPLATWADDKDLRALQQNKLNLQETARTAEDAKEDKDSALWHMLLNDIVRAKKHFEESRIKFQSVNAAFQILRFAHETSGVGGDWLEAVDSSNEIGIVHSFGGQMVILSVAGQDPATYISSGGDIQWDGDGKECDYQVGIGDVRYTARCTEFLSDQGYPRVEATLRTAIKAELSQSN